MTMQPRQWRRWCRASGVIACVLALSACGGGTITTATPPTTATAGVPTLGANVAPPAAPTAPIALTPLATTAASPSPAPADTAPTPTPLINGLTTTTARTDTGMTGVALLPTPTPAPSTAVTGSTSGTRVVSTAGTAVTGGTSAVSGSSASGTRVMGTTTTGTVTTGTVAGTTTTRTATVAGTVSGTTTTTPAIGTRSSATTASEPTDTAVPLTFARGTAEQFLDAVVSKGDISGYLTPTLRAQASNDPNKLLGIMGPIRMFTIDSEKVDADGNGATVHATITTTAGTGGHDFHMRKSGSMWLIDSIS